MCGITGWVDWELDLSQHRETIIQMGETMKHRGPDASGDWVSVHAAMAHSRLIVIDPEGGKQPMIRQYGENQYVITYNGELYNTNELRTELKLLGHHFHSHSDTEVLLTSYIEWGEGCVERLNGIFAFAVWDEQKQQLFMARDRLGVKPLFYTKKHSGLLYGSEIKSLLAHPDIHPVVKQDGLSEIFGLGPSRTPGNAIFNGVNELRPGHFLLFNRQGIKIQQYWKLESKEHDDDLQTTIEKIRSLVIDAVERQLVSDVPICTFLSGGLDSSFITSIAAEKYRKNGKRLNTFSVDYLGNEIFFKESEFQPNSDAKWIEIMTDFTRSNHHYVFLDNQELFSALHDAVVSRDIPGMADVDSSLLLFSREIKKNATVALSGECADEIFGGYPWFYRQADLESNTFPWLRSIEQREQILSPELREHLHLKEYVEKRYRETLAEVPRLHTESNNQHRIRELFYLNMTWFMSTLLERKDRMTMATGLEVRVPFADHRLVEYAWNIPWEMKNLNNREKGLLRAALKGILPDEVLYRKKSPYPKTHNPVYTNIISEQMQDILHDPNSPILTLIDKSTVESFIKNIHQGTDPWFGQLMTGPQMLAYLIQVNIWLNEYRIQIQ